MLTNLVFIKLISIHIYKPQVLMGEDETKKKLKYEIPFLYKVTCMQADGHNNRINTNRCFGP